MVFLVTMIFLLFIRVFRWMGVAGGRVPVVAAAYTVVPSSSLLRVIRVMVILVAVMGRRGTGHIVAAVR